MKLTPVKILVTTITLAVVGIGLYAGRKTGTQTEANGTDIDLNDLKNMKPANA